MSAAMSGSEQTLNGRSSTGSKKPLSTNPSSLGSAPTARPEVSETALGQERSSRTKLSVSMPSQPPAPHQQVVLIIYETHHVVAMFTPRITAGFPPSHIYACVHTDGDSACNFSHGIVLTGFFGGAWENENKSYL